MKVAIVTGAGKGIGAEIARHLLSQNYHVVLAEFDPTTNPDLEGTLFVKTDVRKERSIRTLIKKTIERFGRIDALINNAGIMPQKDVPIEKMSLDLWNQFIETNLTGPFLCAKYAIPYLRKTKGAIVNIASTRAVQSEGGDEAYSATKGGLVSLTHAMAVTLGPDIRVNCVSPGWIHTDKSPLRKIDHAQHPAGRVGKPKDIASMVSYLLSDQAKFITGQNFIIDGGMTIKMIYAP